MVEILATPSCGWISPVEYFWPFNHLTFFQMLNVFEKMLKVYVRSALKSMVCKPLFEMPPNLPPHRAPETLATPLYSSPWKLQKVIRLVSFWNESNFVLLLVVFERCCQIFSDHASSFNKFVIISDMWFSRIW